MSATHDFHYRLPTRTGGWRPGAHKGLAMGSGEDFVAHASLFARPDPRRIDLRASLRDPRGDWLVRLARQRTSVPVAAVVDTSASMGFGAPHRKIALVADFVEALARSTQSIGDPLELIVFDERIHEALGSPPSRHAGLGALLAERLRAAPCTAPGHGALLEAVSRLAGREALVFLVSDFHGYGPELSEALDALSRAQVVPIVVWSRQETTPPEGSGLAQLRDLERGRVAELWLRPRLRARWQAAVDARRLALSQILESRGLRPFFMPEPFDGDALTRYFLEGA
ncbi:MAG: VWA domain-containing protein [Rhodocyclaceae bacterium]|nr:VWA domain-containing protein [Rhodocyclaceae bacterium]